MKITSHRNPGIQHLLELREKSALRRKEGLFYLEGVREVRLALANGYRLKQLYHCPGLPGAESVSDLFTGPVDTEILEVSPSVYEKMAVRGGTGGVLALALSKELKLRDIGLSGNPLILVAEGIEKPGNIGALLRTADAAGLDCVILCDILTDLYNPNIIRSSLGCVFSRKVAVCTSVEAIEWLSEKEVKVYPARVDGSIEYTSADFSKPSAIVVGAEDKGLSSQWNRYAENNIAITMTGNVDSLNVSVTAAILTFEAIRQRRQ